MSPEMIEIKNISFAYGKEPPVLNDISADIQTGEIVGVLGPNGAGKSTLIKIMAGVLKPAKGKVLIDNKELSEISLKQRSSLTAYVPQENFFPFPFTALETVLMGRAARLPFFGFESKKDIETAMDTMKVTDTAQFAKRAVNELSGGERQRVLIARALAQQSKYLLLDEPAAYLDIKHQLRLHTILDQQRKRENKGIICAMHDLNLAARFCDRVLLLKSGRVIASGSATATLTETTIFETFGVRATVMREKEICIVFETKKLTNY